jgi:reductive dehalogenase
VTQEGDHETGFDVLDYFERFDQKFDVFNRSSWDPTMRSQKAQAFYTSHNMGVAPKRNTDGFRQEDYALRNASWQVMHFFADLKLESEDRSEGFLDSYTVHSPPAPNRRAVSSPEAMSREIKAVAKLFGADLAGICAYDERWIYTHNYSRRKDLSKPVDLPPGLTSVIVTAHAMEHDVIQTVPSVLSGAATGWGYSQDLLTVVTLAQYIRDLGYQAVASLNDTALSVPLAVQAGLGEYGRHGLLITKGFGPRVRLGKVFTDMPLAHDKPIRFGVREFCEVCRRCEQSCPPKAIPGGPPTDTTFNISNIRGVRKWTTNAEKCFGFWVNQGTDCSICIRVCPYNKEYPKRIYRIGRWLAGTRLRRLMLRLDSAMGYGKRVAPTEWWTRLKRRG